MMIPRSSKKLTFVKDRAYYVHELLGKGGFASVYRAELVLPVASAGEGVGVQRRLPRDRPEDEETCDLPEFDSAGPPQDNNMVATCDLPELGLDEDHFGTTAGRALQRQRAPSAVGGESCAVGETSFPALAPFGKRTIDLWENIPSSPSRGSEPRLLGKNGKNVPREQQMFRASGLFYALKIQTAQTSKQFAAFVKETELLQKMDDVVSAEDPERPRSSAAVQKEASAPEQLHGADHKGAVLLRGKNHSSCVIGLVDYEVFEKRRQVLIVLELGVCDLGKFLAER